MNETPLPLVVWAMMIVGRSWICAASSNASTTCRTSMPVDLHHVPAAGRPFIRQRFQRHDLVHRAIQLDIVVIQDGGQVGQAIFGRGHRPFPDDPALAFAIAEQDVGAVDSVSSSRAASASPAPTATP